MSVAGEIEPVDRRYNHRGISPLLPPSPLHPRPSVDPSNGIFDSRLRERRFVSLPVLPLITFAFPFALLGRRNSHERAASVCNRSATDSFFTRVCSGDVRGHCAKGIDRHSATSVRRTRRRSPRYRVAAVPGAKGVNDRNLCSRVHEQGRAARRAKMNSSRLRRLPATLDRRTACSPCTLW